MVASSVADAVKALFIEALSEGDVKPFPDINDNLILLESGLDSLGFATLVAKLESALGYDPFTLMEQPFYPQTLGEFVRIYEQYRHHLRQP